MRCYMKIGMLENGIDSLQRGFSYFSEFEQSTVGTLGKDDYMNLKQAVLSIHHGVEILMKYILFKKSEFLIISKFDSNYMHAYAEKEKHQKISIFATSRADNVHTITFEEALVRLEYFSTVKIPGSFRDKLMKLNKIRNSLTHAEININDEEIIDLFRSLLNDIDITFFRAIGDDYKTITGYDKLLSNYDSYMKLLKKKDMQIKTQAVEVFKETLEKNSISFGQQSVIYVDDIKKAQNIIKNIFKSDLEFGMDMFNGYTSGDISMMAKDEQHFAIHANDNKSEYIFKFKSLIIIYPTIVNNYSPMIIFESGDDDSYNQFKEENVINETAYDKKYIEGIYIDDKENPSTIYDIKTINEFEARCNYDETYHIPEHYYVKHFFSRSIFACINVQGLVFLNFRNLLKIARDEGYDGAKMKIFLEGLLKKKQSI